MPYTTQTLVEAKIPPQLLNEALDDNKDGLADDGLLDTIIAAVSTEIDSRLAGLYAVPFATVPAVVSAAALDLVCEMIYQRRGYPADQNPFSKPAAAHRAKLDQIGSGAIPLEAAIEKETAPLRTVTYDMTVDADIR